MQVKKELEKILQTCPTAGVVPCYGIAEELPSLPGLSIHGLGPISVPLGDHDVVHMIQKATSMPSPHQKQYALRDEPIHRKPQNYEFNPHQIKFDNPEWKNGMDQLVQRLTQESGVDMAHLNYQLDRMILSEPGAPSVFCDVPDPKDEQCKSLIATLVVQLPSDFHGGGSMVVPHFGKIMRFDLGSHTRINRFKCFYGFHNKNVPHKLLPMSNGHRLVLVYRLYYKIPVTVEDMEMDVEMDMQLGMETPESMQCAKDLMQVIQKWDVGKMNVLVLPLKNDYDRQEMERLGFRSLRGRDRDYVQVLKDANLLLSRGQQPLSMCIVPATKTDEYISHGWNPYYQDPEDAEWEEDYDLTDIDDGIEENGRLHDEKLLTQAMLQDPEHVVFARTLKDIEQCWGRSRDSYDESDPGIATKTSVYKKFFLCMWKEHETNKHKLSSTKMKMEGEEHSKKLKSLVEEQRSVQQP
jgi:hypothetical protein